VLLIAGGALAAPASAQLHAESQTPTALSGRVTSAEQGPMEGVLVRDKKDTSTINVNVAIILTDQCWLVVAGADFETKPLLTAFVRFFLSIASASNGSKKPARSRLLIALRSREE
jgi:hypothetical protein